MIILFLCSVSSPIKKQTKKNHQKTCEIHTQIMPRNVFILSGGTEVFIFFEVVAVLCFILLCFACLGPVC